MNRVLDIMKPPLPDPFEVPKPPKKMTKKVEWDEEQQCFVIYYSSTVLGRLRCEWGIAQHIFYNMIGLVIFFPLTLLFLVLFNFLRSEKRPNSFFILSQGIRDVTPEMSGEIPWSEFKSVQNRSGDVIVVRQPFYKSSTYIPRESFSNLEQSQRLEGILRELSANNGSNWNEVVAKYKT